MVMVENRLSRLPITFVKRRCQNHFDIQINAFLKHNSFVFENELSLFKSEIKN